MSWSGRSRSTSMAAADWMRASPERVNGPERKTRRGRMAAIDATVQQARPPQSPVAGPGTAAFDSAP